MAGLQFAGMCSKRIWSVVLPTAVVLFLLSRACPSQEPEVFRTALPGDLFPSGPSTGSTETGSAETRSSHALSRSGKVPGSIGIAPTPRNFPRHTTEDVRDMIAQAADLGTVAVLIYQWSDKQYQQTATHLVKLAREAGMKVVVGLSPTTLDQQRKELDVPSHLRGILSKPSFKKENVRQAFVAASKDLARLKPPYLCLATEINLLALQRMEEFLHFVEVYKQAYQAVKQISPDTKVFVSFQFEFVRILDNKEPGKIEAHAKIVDIFRPELDVLAITSYPAEFYANPDHMPINYYLHWRRYLKPAEEVMVMEVGWPSSGLGTPAEQRRFVERLPVLLAELTPSITAWALLHDVKLSEFGENLASTGLLTATGQPKISLEVFRRFGPRPDSLPGDREANAR